MGAKVRHAICALFGCILGLGAGVGVNHMSGTSVGLAPPPAGVTLALVISEAHAGTKSKKNRRARKEAAIRAADEKDQERIEDGLVGTSVKELPADCTYDSYATATAGTDIYSCGGMNYQRFEENGVVSYKGHASGLDPKDVKKARARRAKADKQRKEDAKKKKQANRKAELPTDCFYDAQASALKGADLYSCGGVLYRQYTENGVTGYEVAKP